MTAAPSVVVSVPARSAAEARREIARAREQGADLAEVRWDRWPPAERPEVRRLFPSPLPLVATFRSRAEGGEAPSEASERLRGLLTLAGLPFRFLDVEADRDLPLAGPLARALHRPEAPRLIVSSHLPEGASTEEIRRRLRTGPAPPAIVKVVLPAGVAELLERVLPALPPPGFGAFVVHTTGRSGPLLRAWAGRRGMALVYARLGPAQDPRGAVELSQLPADALSRFLRSPEPAPLFGLLGRGLSSSPSPELHHRWMHRADVAGLYLLLDLADEDELARALPALVAGGFRGFNVTLPFKVAALALADRAGPGAEKCGCANTLTVDGGALVAENTDLAALLRRIPEIEDSRGREFGRVTVLGSGGAARAALAAASELGRPSEIVARRPEAAEALASRFGAEVRAPMGAGPAELLIHATPAGRPTSPELELPLDGLIGPGTYLLDFVYRPHHRFLAQRAAQHGAAYEDGWRLLVYQAAESFAIWHGSAPGPGDVAAPAEAE